MKLNALGFHFPSAQQSLQLWSQGRQRMPHQRIRDRLSERSDEECYLAIDLLAHNGELDSNANQVISRLACRYLDSTKILDFLEPRVRARFASVMGRSKSAPNPRLLPQFLEVNALAVEGWVRLARSAVSTFN